MQTLPSSKKKKKTVQPAEQTRVWDRTLRVVTASQGLCPARRQWSLLLFAGESQPFNVCVHDRLHFLPSLELRVVT